MRASLFRGTAVSLLMAICVSPAWTTAVLASEPLNVVFIIADDLGVMDTTPYNPESFYETPHLQTLAQSGMRFTNGYAACPVCSPTRSAVMTGQWPARTRNTDYFGAPNQFLGQDLPADYEPARDGSFGRHADRHIFLVREEKGKRGFLCFPRTLKPRAHVSLHHTPSTLFLSQHTHSISIVRYTIHIYSLPRMRSRPRIRRPRTKKPRAPHPPLHREGAEPSAP